jgi:hypothetical protein
MSMTWGSMTWGVAAPVFATRRVLVLIRAMPVEVAQSRCSKIFRSSGPASINPATRDASKFSPRSLLEKEVVQRQFSEMTGRSGVFSTSRLAITL